MAQDKTQFLHFNAYSIKEMIVRKLTEDTDFTDQIYEGSNLNILIDLVAYMYQCLMYNLNNAASESMFADTRLYENMNRLVKFLGYNPKAIMPSVGQFYITNSNNDQVDKYIQKYTMVNTGKVDQYGNPVYFSTIKDIHIDSTNTGKMFKFTMYNGRWQLYDTIFVASGSEYESFVLQNIRSDIKNANGDLNQLIANNGIHVYVQHTQYDENGDEQKSLTQFEVVDEELFLNTKIDVDITSYARIYTKNDNICNVRLNESKQFEIKFGNGVIGKKLTAGDEIYIMYFATNGYDGKILLDEYTINKLEHSSAMLGMTTDLYRKMFNNKLAVVSEEIDMSESPDVYLINTTTDAIAEDSVDDIRNFAPEWFKMGQRLITKNDYEFYMKNLRKGEVRDAICQNNYEYASTFYAWLYQLGVEKHRNSGAGKYYLNRYVLTKNKTVWADPVDMNNVYIWVKMKDESSIETLKKQYIDDIQKIKCMTANVIFLDAIDMNFSVTAMPEERIKQLVQSDSYLTNTESYIEVTMDNDIIYASAVVAEQIDSIIKQFFNIERMEFGKTVNYNEILEQILNIDGVSRIRTIYIPNNDVLNPIIIDGLSFASWSNNILDPCDDVIVSNGTRTLYPFQFPRFVDINLKDRIKVIKRSINYGSKMQY